MDLKLSLGWVSKVISIVAAGHYKNLYIFVQPSFVLVTSVVWLCHNSPYLIRTVVPLLFVPELSMTIYLD